MRLPTYAQLEGFCRRDGWDLKARRSRRKGGDHLSYAKTLRDGTVLYTQISHGAGGIQDPDLFKFILRDQLKVTEEQFWACVDDGLVPEREGDLPEEPTFAKDAVPYDLLRNLMRAGYAQDDVLAGGKTAAVELWQQHPSARGLPKDSEE